MPKWGSASGIPRGPLRGLRGVGGAGESPIRLPVDRAAGLATRSRLVERRRVPGASHNHEPSLSRVHRPALRRRDPEGHPRCRVPRRPCSRPIHRGAGSRFGPEVQGPEPVQAFRPRCQRRRGSGDRGALHRAAGAYEIHGGTMSGGGSPTSESTVPGKRTHPFPPRRCPSISG